MGAPLPGFADPSIDSARCFRTILDAFSRLGTIQEVTVNVAGVDALHPASAMIALTLCDHDTPVWLDPSFGEEVSGHIRFHCGSPIVSDCSDAQFAFFGNCPGPDQLDRLKAGTPDYPDQSATAIIQIGSLDDGKGTLLSGPGIKSGIRFCGRGLTREFWDWRESSVAQFPLGPDFIFATPKAIAALPRSTRLMESV